MTQSSKTRVIEEAEPRQGFTRSDAFAALLFFAAYVLVAQIGRWFFTLISSSSSSSFAIILVPAGVALAGLLALGYRFWPVIALGSLFSGVVLGSAPLIVVLSGTTGNVLQALLGFYVFRKSEFNANALRAKDILVFLAVAVGTTIVGPTFSIGARWLIHEESSVRWTFLWISGILSVTIFTPLLVAWVRLSPIKQFRKNASETLIAFTLLVGVDFLIFWTAYPTFKGFPLVILQLALLFWIAMRMDSAHITSALFITTAIGLSGPFLGMAPPLAADFSRRIVSIQVYMIIISLLFYSITAISQERNSINESRKEYIRRLEEALESIRSSDTAKIEFISILAHELRNPLAPIVSYLELLKGKIGNDTEAENYVTTIEENVQNITRLLDDLLDVSRVSQQRFTMHKEVASLRSIIDFAIRTSTPTVEASNHELIFSLPEDDMFVEIDPARFQQVLLNIINNAVRYSKPGSVIALSCRRDSGYAVIKIKDNGIGIEPEMADRIFEPFVQASKKYSDLGGLGVGLYLSKKFVELHGGTIGVQSDGKDKGSEFIIRLPLLRTGTSKQFLPVRSKTKNEMSLSRVNSIEDRKYKILLVDDNKQALESLAKLLQRVGHSVEIASEGSSALIAAKEFRPDIIFLDIGLPGMNGYDVARKLRKELGFSGAIIALTGYGQNDDRRKARQAGFNKHITKPIRLADVEAAIQDVT